jgi:hypothetical protein
MGGWSLVSEIVMDEQPRRGTRRNSRLIITVLVLIILALTGVCAYLFLHYRSANTGQTQAEQTTALIDWLKQTVSLPANEQPSVATVLDRTKLGDQQLAVEARNGDTLLVYAKAKRVILYRPSTQKVIDMFHIEADQASGSDAVKQTPKP